MSETGEDGCPPMPQTLLGAQKLLCQLVQILAADLPQFPSFEQIPDPLLRIEVRRIASPGPWS
jgi:hypothetical protein